MVDLRARGVDILTLGQYLRPSSWHLPVQEWISPGRFAAYRERGLALGFRYVASGPLVRSSYRAAELFLRGEIAARR
jgi:lipoic acid synthetase